MLNHAVSESGCTKTIFSASWLVSYLKVLTEFVLARLME